MMPRSSGSLRTKYLQPSVYVFAGQQQGENCAGCLLKDVGVIAVAARIVLASLKIFLGILCENMRGCGNPRTWRLL